MDTHGGTAVKLVLKGVVGTTLDSRKDTQRVFQADRMTGGRTRRATCLVRDGEKTIAQRSPPRREDEAFTQVERVLHFRLRSLSSMSSQTVYFHLQIFTESLRVRETHEAQGGRALCSPKWKRTARNDSSQQFPRVHLPRTPAQAPYLYLI